METRGEKIGLHLWKEELLKMVQEMAGVIILGEYNSPILDICFSQYQRTAKQTCNSCISCIWLYIDFLVIYT